MNKLPYSNGQITRSMSAFGGLCAKHRANDGDIVDMCDMSSDKYPLLTPRRGRAYIDTGEYKVFGVTNYKSEPVLLTDKGIYYRGNLIDEYEYDDKQTILCIGDYISVFPVGRYVHFEYKYYWCAEAGTDKTMLYETTYSEDAIDVDGACLDDKLPETASVGDRYLLQSDDKARIYEYTENNKWEFVSLADVNQVYRARKMIVGDISKDERYTGDANINFILSDSKGTKDKNDTDNPKTHWKIVRKNTSFNMFSTGDFVNIYVGRTTNISSANNENIINMKNGVTVTAVGDGFIVVTRPNGRQNDSDDSLFLLGSMRIVKHAPGLEILCVKDNRIYGASGSTVYISELGNPTNFTSYSLASTSAWTAETAGDDFVACIPYEGSVIFFKQRQLYRVYGDTASEFGFQSIICPGVMPGSERSLTASSGYLYYLSSEGVMRYGGGYPVLMSDGIDLTPGASVAGADDKKYYLYTDGVIYVYDTRYGLWYKESVEGNCKGFFNVGTTLYAISGEGNRLYIMSGEAENGSFAGFEVTEGNIPTSSITFADITEGTLFKKEYKRMRIRLAVLSGKVNVRITYDGDEEAVDTIEIHASESGKRVIYKDVMLKRCDYMSIKISGTGDYVIYGIDRDVCISSDEELMYKY